MPRTFAGLALPWGFLLLLCCGCGDELWKVVDSAQILAAQSSDYAVPPGAPWQYRESPLHLGVARPGESVRIPPKLLWVFEGLNVGTHGASKASPVADEERVYIGGDNERFYALDKVTGQVVWRWITRVCKEGIHATAAVDDLNVYIGDYTGWLTALDKRTGSVVFETKLGGSIGASPVLVGDRIYVGTETRDPDGYLSVVNRLTGQVIYHGERLGNHTHCTPTVDPKTQRVYMGSNRGIFHCYDARDGSPIWSFRARGTPEPMPRVEPQFHGQIKGTAALADGHVIFTAWDNHLYSLDAGTGKLRWAFRTGMRNMSSPSVDLEKRRVYFGSHDNNIYALTLDEGKEVWRFKTGARVYASGVLVPRKGTLGKVLLHGSFDKHLYALDDDTGEQIWKTRVRGAVTSVPLVSDGRLYLATNGGQLLCWE